MNAKNELIEKLLKVAKKHKVLTYPVLALVAVISVFNYFFSWSTGAGKRVVAVVMVLVMLVSQSYFLTSSANALVDDANSLLVQEELQNKTDYNDVAEDNASDTVEDNDTDNAADAEVKDNASDNETATDDEAVVASDNNISDITPDNVEAADNETASDLPDEAGIADGSDAAPEAVADEFTEDNEMVYAADPAATDKAVLIKYHYYEDDLAGNKSDVERTITRTVYVSENATSVDLETDITAVSGLNDNYNKTLNDGCYAYDFSTWYTTPSYGDATPYSIVAGQKNTIYSGLNFSDSLEGRPAAEIHLYCKRSVSKYCITVDAGGATYDISGYSDQVTDNKYHVIDGTEVTISNALLKCYDLTGYSVGGSVTKTTPDAATGAYPDTFKFTLSNLESPYVKVVMSWTGKTYYIWYAKTPKPSSPEDYTKQPVTYGDPTAKLWDDTNVIAKTGYDFAGWVEEGSASSDVYEKNRYISSISTDKQQYWCENSPAMLVPTFTYKELEAKSGTEFTFEYSAKGEGTFSVGYKNTPDTSNTKFVYNISATDRATLKDIYGITVLPEPAPGKENTTYSTGLKFTTERAKKTTGGFLQISVTVRDESDGDEEYYVTSEPFTVKIEITPKQVNITAQPGSANKYYDKTKVSGLSIEPLATDSVYIDGNNAYPIFVIFTGSEYDEADAGERELLLSGVSFQVPGVTEFTSGWEDNYIKPTKINGKIKPRRVEVDVIAKDEDGSWSDSVSVKAGTKNPEAKINPETIQGEDGPDGLLSGDNLYPVECTWDRTGDLENTSKTYKCTVTKWNNSNYDVKTRTAARLTVYAEDPGTLYYIDGEKLTGNNWYYSGSGSPKRTGVKIAKNTADYDTIIVADTKGGEHIYDEIKDCKDKTVWIRLKNSVSGAVTSWESIELNVDTKAPEFDNFTLQTVDNSEEFYDDKTGRIPEKFERGDLFFPAKGMLSFGNYFNNDVRVTIEFNDNIVDGVNGSEVKTCYYRLKGASSYTPVPASTKPNGKATFSFSLSKVVADKIGEIEFYAEDYAGNKNPENPEKLTKKAGSSLWCYEKDGKPGYKDLKLYYGDNKQEFDYAPISLNKYYSNATVELTAVSELAGIYSVEWFVNGESTGAERVADTSKSLPEYVFRKDFNKKNPEDKADSGRYVVTALITDNAGKTVTPEPSVTFMLDNYSPDIQVGVYNKWMQKAEVKFEVSDDASGVEYIRVIRQNPDGTEETIEHEVETVAEDGKCSCHFDQTIKGDYAIVAVDKAGNKRVVPVPLHYLSQEVPECPEVTVTPEMDPEKQWYNGTENVDVTIKPAPATPDGTSVITYYQLWKDGETALNREPVDGTSKTVTIPGDGHYHMLTWAESMTGVRCDKNHKDTLHKYEFFVDKTAPEIEYIPEKGTGSTLIMRFRITDASSGVDMDSVKVMHEGNEIEAQYEKNGDACVGSFEISETGDYSIEAADKAGNVSKADAFTPMSLKVNAVKNITSSNATVGAFVIKGTSDIQSASISYRKFTDGSYVILGDDVAVKDDITGNIALSAVLSDLEENTPYVYKITATSDLGEVLEYEGYFRTLAEGVLGVSVSGVARYANETQTGNITVGLFKGNVCNMATEIAAGDQFTFDNIPDGNYNIIATDGKYSKTIRVLIDDGMVVYPENAIELVLSGKNTSVVITSNDTPDITVDNMDSIFEYDIVNYTNEDVRLVETEGGVVEFKLYATLITIASVSSEEIAAMYAVTDSGKIVGAYLDLSLVKETTDAAGVKDRKKVTELGRGASVSVTIPLGDLAGKPGLEVVRIHNDGEKFLGQSLRDEDNNPGTYTISTNQFSTYAILYSGTPAAIEPEKPGTETPTPGTPSIVTPDVPAGTPQGGTNNTPDQGGTGNNDNPQKDDDKKKDKNKDNKKKPIKQDDSKRGEGNNGSSVGSLKSSGTAKTGDATPIEAMGTIMLISVAGIFVLRKKIK